MKCLRCNRPLSSGSSDEIREDFCSARCAEQHRLHILDRLQTLRSEEEPEDETRVGDLLALSRSVEGRAEKRGLEKAFDGQRPLGRMVTFLPVKGGSGASTTALHAAESIARKTGERVLLIDFDFHSGTTAFRLGIEPAGSLETLLAADIVGPAQIEGAVGRWGPLDLLVPRKAAGPAVSDFSKLDAILVAALNRYAVVVADHPDGIYTSSRPVLSVSSEVYLVCAPEIAALHLARQKRCRIESGGSLSLIVNRAGSMGALSPSDVQRVTGLPVTACLSNDYAAVRQAGWHGGLVESQSKLALDFEALADIIVRRIEGFRTEAAPEPASRSAALQSGTLSAF